MQNAVERAYIKRREHEIANYTLWATTIQTYIKDYISKAKTITREGVRWEMIYLSDARDSNPFLKHSRCSYDLGRVLEEVLPETNGWHQVRISGDELLFIR